MRLPTPLLRDLPPIWREGRTGLELAGLLRDPAFRQPALTGAGRPVLLIPGFLVGDETLALMTGWLRRGGYRASGAGMRSNVACAKEALDALERRLEERAAGRRIALIGHSHGGTLARSLAIRRPDLVSGVVALASPLVDQFDLHPLARLPVRLVSGLGSLGTPGLFRRECLRGECCDEIHEATVQPFPAGVGFVTVYSRTDGVVNWRACLDPRAKPVEVTSSHVGMAVNVEAYRAVRAALGAFVAERPQAKLPVAAAPGLG